MRTRHDIENEVEQEPYGRTYAESALLTNQALILEVLLDLRDPLTKPSEG
jgi:hypothetical protein